MNRNGAIHASSAPSASNDALLPFIHFWFDCVYVTKATVAVMMKAITECPCIYFKLYPVSFRSALLHPSLRSFCATVHKPFLFPFWFMKMVLNATVVGVVIHDDAV